MLLPPNKSAAAAAAPINRVISDIKIIENSKAFIPEKKYYLKLIEFLYQLGYYDNYTSIKNIWSKK